MTSSGLSEVLPRPRPPGGGRPERATRIIHPWPPAKPLSDEALPSTRPVRATGDAKVRSCYDRALNPAVAEARPFSLVRVAVELSWFLGSRLLFRRRRRSLSSPP